MRIPAILTVALLSVPIARGQARPTVAAMVSPAERRAAGEIRGDSLRAHIRFLASDLLEGRGPATRGDLLAEAYIATGMEALGLEPGAPGGGWIQPFDIVGVTSHVPETVALQGGGGKIDLRYRDDLIAASGVQGPEARLDGAEIVFVGYGIIAPEYQWDDYKGADLKGKVLLMMNNDPEDDPKLFAGKKRLYYGRWDYKYDMAAKQGAAGAIIIHTTPSAGYPWQVVQSSWSGELFSLPAGSEPQLQVKAWATEDACKRLSRLAGQDLDALRSAAQKRDFKPVPLGVTLSLALRNDVLRKKTANVIGRLAGSDPVLSKEAVFITAHHDHLGSRPGARPGEEVIYNGAVDNASGVAAMLAIAEAFKDLPQPPKRTVLFAAVAAEEQGLLGSQYLASHLPLLPGRVAVDINIDGLNVMGKTRDITMIGLGKSSVDDYVKALAAMQGRQLTDDQFPDKGFFYRSDQLNFARIGVPAAYFHVGTDVIGKPPGWGREQHERFEAHDYHQPSDKIKPDWDLGGAVEDCQLFFYLALKIANASHMPAWKPEDEFEAARKRALAEVPKEPPPPR